MAEITRTVAEGVDDITLGKFARSMVDRFGGPDTFLAVYEALAKYHGNNYPPLMGPYFAVHRAALFRVLRSLDLRSTSQDQMLITAVAYLLVHEKRRMKYRLLHEFVPTKPLFSMITSGSAPSAYGDELYRKLNAHQDALAAQGVDYYERRAQIKAEKAAIVQSWSNEGLASGELTTRAVRKVSSKDQLPNTLKIWLLYVNNQFVKLH
jgi:hypothetical protein